MQGSLLRVEHIYSAYQEGWFPMTVDEETNEVEWFAPRRRCLFEEIHISKSLAKTIRKQRFEVTFDIVFEQVMRGCIRPSDNWITEDFVRVYGEAHRQGWGHSAECWRDGHLVGGVYGIAIGGAFFAESMFHQESDASKVALVNLVNKCKELGFVLFDAQILNPHLKSLGAFTVNSDKYKRLLESALQLETSWSALLDQS
jgi:leucyl/phenylalanyl-tRNA---protein transferase